MVMDASPSPQSVGREFVRQYYTLLNKAPNHLHRFYNQQSSFVHDGLEPNNRESSLVIGQKQIHNRIQQLNFRDCHAKISQVDSQVTLGNGVVVQVTGELSNDGQPMRRFTQTFVLAAETPKKYYVHNDIFRYQDVYSDDEADADSERSENDADADTNAAGAVEETPTGGTIQLSQPQAPMYYPMVSQGAATGLQQITQTVQMNGVVHDEMLQSLPTATLLPVSPSSGAVAGAPLVPPSANSGVLPLDPTVAAAQATLPLAQAAAKDPTMQLPAVAEVSVIEAAEKAKAVAAAAAAEEPAKELKEDGLKDDMVPRVMQTETTYANLVKSGGGPPGGLTFASAMAQAGAPGSHGPLGVGQPTVPVSLTRHVTSPPPVKYENSSSGGAGGGGGYRGPRDGELAGALPQRNPGNVPPRQVRERRSSNTNQGAFSDMQQLFLGNIPHQATEEDLKPLFSKYGTVLELRILSKPSSAVKIVGRPPPPNYGFITFADPEAATACHSENNVVFNDGSSDGQKLNIELKKARLRNELGGSGERDRRVMGGGGMPGNGMRSGMNSGAGMGIRGSSNTSMMRPGGNRSLGNGLRGNSFNRSDRTGPMGRGGDGERPTGPIGSGGNTYVRR
ncbi:ras GTPase-activating protein-binding protein 2 [Phlebotomus argentipes]|uniref:ras GTPase-activating protein-binding protein 2 n=1 Tax=Phlebotomus argentipes TaxID=94469 RepID=UPI002892BBA2|nr:ras GTPase-activating protein-binding protein 2 [Phlebotomus argentipes]